MTGKNISRKISQRRIDFVGDIQPLVPQRARLPKQGDLRGDGLLDQFSRGGFLKTGVSLPHQCRNAIAMIQHAFAHHLGGMRRQHRRDQRAVEQRGGLRNHDALRTQEGQCRCQRAVLFRRRALPILGKIRQHGKQHEAAYEGHRFIERQLSQPAASPRGFAMPR